MKLFVRKRCTFEVRNTSDKMKDAVVRERLSWGCYKVPDANDQN